MNIEHVLADEDAVFAAVVTAVVTADADALRSQLKSHPKLATSRARAAHRSTLLHYTAANGIETELQSTPASIYPRLAPCTPDEQLDLQTNALEVVFDLLDVVQFMLDKGVDPKLRDPQFDRTSSGWANAFTQGRVAKLLRQ
jgi:hypothetical protein